MLSRLTLIASLAGSAALVVGCAEEEAETPVDTEPATERAESAMEDAAEAAGAATRDAAEAAEGAMEDAAEAAEEMMEAEGTPVLRGSFSGRNDHVVTGTAMVIRTGDGYLVQLGPDFSLDGAPDPKIGFGNDGSYDEDTTFTRLESISGQQQYAVPAGIDPTGYNELYVWCEQFSVALGVAPLR